jgi:hypothetical protein
MENVFKNASVCVGLGGLINFKKLVLFLCSSLLTYPF